MGGKNKSKSTQSNQNVNSNTGINSGINMNYGLNQSGNFGQNSSLGGGYWQQLNQSQQDVYGAQAPYLQDVYGPLRNAFTQGMADVNALKPGVQQQLGDALAALEEAMAIRWVVALLPAWLTRLAPTPT